MSATSMVSEDAIEESSAVRHGANWRANATGQLPISGAFFTSEKTAINKPTLMRFLLILTTLASATLAIDDQVAIQDVDYQKLSTKLLELGQILTYPQPNPN